jgi:hypothetical protein
MKCQQKKCDLLNDGRVCVATKCNFVYDYRSHREVMRVTHNNMDSNQQNNMEETMGSHHRCAYWFPSDETTSASDMRDQIPNSVSDPSAKANRCRCMCYNKDTSRFQRNVERHTTPNSFENTQENFGTANAQGNTENTTSLSDQDVTAHNALHQTHSTQAYYVGHKKNIHGTQNNDQSDSATAHATSESPTNFPTPHPTAAHSPTPEPTRFPTHIPTPAPTNIPTYYDTTSRPDQTFITDRSASIQGMSADVTNSTIINDLQTEFNQW